MTKRNAVSERMSRAELPLSARKPRAALRIFVALTVALVCWAGTAWGFPIHYVTESGAGSGNGSSWANAHAGVQAALAAAECDDEIWVAEGTYKPTDGDDRYATYQLKDGVALYGGFAGTEENRADRDWVLHKTILSGDLASDDGPDWTHRDDNAHQVVTGSGTDASAVLDGFTVTSGNASDYYGGGMYNNGGSPTVTHCTFIGNWALDGGGMYNEDGSPTVTDCTFFGNAVDRGGGYGGGMCNSSSSPTVTNCIFSGNSACDGGGMYNDDSSPTVTGCTFSDNIADGCGGGMYNWESSPNVDHCTFSGNFADDFGGGFYNGHSNPTVMNCTLSGNSADWGGGMYNNDSNPTVTDCDFSRNLASIAAGMYNGLSNSTVADCTFSENVASFSAGGMYNWGGSPMVIRCTFSGNRAVDGAGGGMYNDDSSPTVMNCTLSGNSADWGGGMTNQASSPTVMNCTFSGNTAPRATAIYNRGYPDPSFATLANTILTGDCDGSITSGGYNLESGTSCGCTQPTDQQNADPLLGPLQDNGGPTWTHALLPCSPAIDAIPSPYNGAPAADQRGFPRPYPAGGLADIGAVEMQFAYPPGDVNDDGAIDLLDVVLCAQIARGLVGATTCWRSMADVDGDGDVDADDVTILSEYVLGIRATLP